LTRVFLRIPGRRIRRQRRAVGGLRSQQQKVEAAAMGISNWIKGLRGTTHQHHSLRAHSLEPLEPQAPAQCGLGLAVGLLSGPGPGPGHPADHGEPPRYCRRAGSDLWTPGGSRRTSAALPDQGRGVRSSRPMQIVVVGTSYNGKQRGLCVVRYYHHRLRWIPRSALTARSRRPSAASARLWPECRDSSPT